MGIEIILNNPGRSYFAGEVVDGRVLIFNRKPDQVREVTIWLQGSGRADWRVPMSLTGAVDDNKNIEHYISYNSTVAGDGVTLVTLPDGKITYPFHFVLPKDIPSSFNDIADDSSCQISYVLKAEIKRSILKKNDKAKVPITVNGIFDLNLRPSASEPRECRLKKGPNVFQLRMGEISCLLRLPTRCGFVPGEEMDFRVEITNNSNQKVYRMTASLRQVISLYLPDFMDSKGKQQVTNIKTVKNTISIVEGPEVNEGEHEIWADTLLIPPLPPTSLGVACHIADLEYFLYVEAKMTGLKNTLSGEIPVMIGTIPLRSTFENIRRAHGDTSSSLRLEAALPDYPDLPPPSYADAVIIDESTEKPGESNSENEGDASDSSSESAPFCNGYVPNYITYK